MPAPCVGLGSGDPAEDAAGVGPPRLWSPRSLLGVPAVPTGALSAHILAQTQNCRRDWPSSCAGSRCARSSCAGSHCAGSSCAGRRLDERPEGRWHECLTLAASSVRRHAPGTPSVPRGADDHSEKRPKGCTKARSSWRLLLCCLLWVRTVLTVGRTGRCVRRAHIRVPFTRRVVRVMVAGARIRVPPTHRVLCVSRNIEGTAGPLCWPHVGAGSSRAPPSTAIASGCPFLSLSASQRSF